MLDSCELESKRVDSDIPTDIQVSHDSNCQPQTIAVYVAYGVASSLTLHICWSPANWENHNHLYLSL
jgi:hypothetical protein